MLAQRSYLPLLKRKARAVEVSVYVGREPSQFGLVGIIVIYQPAKC